MVPPSSMDPNLRARTRYLSRANLPVPIPVLPLSAFPASIEKQVTPFIEACLSGTAIKGLLFHGPPGTGKSTLAVSLLHKVLSEAPRDWLGFGEYDARRPGYFIHHTEFISLHHDSWRSDDYAEKARDLLRSLYFRSMHDYENTRLLVLDDAGKENPMVGTGHKSQVMSDVIRARYNKGAPSLATTNIHIDAWEDNYGAATASFLQEAFTIVSMPGKDRRK